MSTFHVVGKNIFLLCILSFSFAGVCSGQEPAINSYFMNNRVMYGDYQFCLQLLNADESLKDKFKVLMGWAFASKLAPESEKEQRQEFVTELKKSDKLPGVYKTIVTDYIATVSHKPWSLGRKIALGTSIALPLIAVALAWKYRHKPSGDNMPDDKVLVGVEKDIFSKAQALIGSFDTLSLHQKVDATGKKKYLVSGYAMRKSAGATNNSGESVFFRDSEPTEYWFDEFGNRINGDAESKDRLSVVYRRRGIAPLPEPMLIPQPDPIDESKSKDPQLAAVPPASPLPPVTVIQKREVKKIHGKLDIFSDESTDFLIQKYYDLPRNTPNDWDLINILDLEIQRRVTVEGYGAVSVAIDGFAKDVGHDGRINRLISLLKGKINKAQEVALLTDSSAVLAYYNESLSVFGYPYLGGLFREAYKRKDERMLWILLKPNTIDISVVSFFCFDILDVFYQAIKDHDNNTQSLIKKMLGSRKEEIFPSSEQESSASRSLPLKALYFLIISSDAPKRASIEAYLNGKSKNFRQKMMLAILSMCGQKNDLVRAKYFIDKSIESNFLGAALEQNKTMATFLSECIQKSRPEFTSYILSKMSAKDLAISTWWSSSEPAYAPPFISAVQAGDLEAVNSIISKCDGDFRTKLFNQVDSSSPRARCGLLIAVDNVIEKHLESYDEVLIALLAYKWPLGIYQEALRKLDASKLELGPSYGYWKQLIEGAFGREHLTR